MRITCPWCGPRALDEYEYHGDASKIRPTGDEHADLDAWVDYVYYRDNPAGMHREYWQHIAGCRSWLIVARNTTTHKISDVVLAHPLACEDKK